MVQNASGFVATKDQNVVAQMMANYNNQALEALAVNLTNQSNTCHGTNFVFSMFVVCEFVCALACF